MIQTLKKRIKEILKVFTIVITLYLPFSVMAEVKLPALLSSNMVLQRNAVVKLWGWADTGEKITIKVSWLDEAHHVIPNNDGFWSVGVQTTNSKEQQSITIKSEYSDIKLENVLFGEVWLCSGQSNMEMPLRGFNGQPVFGSLNAIAKATNPNLRLFKVNRKASITPLNDLEYYEPWQMATPDNVGSFSAVAYFFAEQLQDILDVPVGIILSSWGASTVQAWMSQESIKDVQSVDLDSIGSIEKPNKVPTLLFNGMIYPLTKYTIKGVLWYQGEGNRFEPEMYKKLFPAMVEDWRNQWGLGDFSFNYVQIAPFLYGNNHVFQDVKNSAFMREVQSSCSEMIANSTIAITMDLGAKNFIHPPKKKEVADRLLFNVLKNTYGYKSIDGGSPVFESHEMKDGGILLSFNHAQSGLYANGELKDFEIAGEDKVFYPAEAFITDRWTKVFVRSAKVKKPVAVRYAWRNWVQGTLFGGNMLPVSSFRTDNWDDAVRME